MSINKITNLIAEYQGPDITTGQEVINVVTSELNKAKAEQVSPNRGTLSILFERELKNQNEADCSFFKRYFYENVYYHVYNMSEQARGGFATRSPLFYRLIPIMMSELSLIKGDSTSLFMTRFKVSIAFRAALSATPDEKTMKSLAKAIQARKLTVLPVGFQGNPGHSIAIVFCNGYLVILNTEPDVHIRTIKAFKIDPRLITADHVKELYKHKFESDGLIATKFIYFTLPAELSPALDKKCTTDEICKVLEDLSPEPQKGPFCTFEAAMASIIPSEALLQLEDNLSAFKSAGLKAKEGAVDLLTYMRLRLLKQDNMGVQVPENLNPAIYTPNLVKTFSALKQSPLLTAYAQKHFALDYNTLVFIKENKDLPSDPKSIFTILLRYAWLDSRSFLKLKGKALELLSQLNPKLKGCILYYIWQLAGSPQTEDDNWGLNHAFDDADRFYRAVKMCVLEECERLRSKYRGYKYPGGGFLSSQEQQDLDELLTGKDFEKDPFRTAELLDVAYKLEPYNTHK